MSSLKIYTTKSRYLKKSSFYPRNYDPIYLFVKENLTKYNSLEDFLINEVKGGSTPPYYLFLKHYEGGIPFVKTSAISSDFLNINDLYYIQKQFHETKIKRSIAKPFDVIYSMTGKFMGKAALCPNILNELNMSQNSVVLKTKSPLHSAFLTIYLNSDINKNQVIGKYSITKQKYLNQGKIAKLKILNFKRQYEKNLLDYLDGIKYYYNSIDDIRKIISKFNELFEIPIDAFDQALSYSIKSNFLNYRILTAQYYRDDYGIFDFERENDLLLSDFHIQKGNEIGSKNYQLDGVPFIKTSNFLNFGVDYQPNYYCSEAIYNELSQDLQKGDIIFTKDGKIGEVAILEEFAKIVVSSGIVRIRPQNDRQRYHLFLLLSSDFGKLIFNRWTVIASTMAHLRKDFYREFYFPKVEPRLLNNLIMKTQNAFQRKRQSYEKIELSKKRILSKLYKIINLR